MSGILKKIGVFAAGVAVAYNVILGTSFAVKKFAAIGSIVFMAASGGASASQVE
jgi:hypothetical protein